MYSFLSETCICCTCHVYKLNNTYKMLEKKWFFSLVELKKSTLFEFYIPVSWTKAYVVINVTWHIYSVVSLRQNALLFINFTVTIWWPISCLVTDMHQPSCHFILHDTYNMKVDVCVSMGNILQYEQLISLCAILWVVETWNLWLRHYKYLKWLAILYLEVYCW